MACEERRRQRFRVDPAWLPPRPPRKSSRPWSAYPTPPIALRVPSSGCKAARSKHFRNIWNLSFHTSTRSACRLFREYITFCCPPLPPARPCLPQPPTKSYWIVQASRGGGGGVHLGPGFPNRQFSSGEKIAKEPEILGAQTFLTAPDPPTHPPEGKTVSTDRPPHHPTRHTHVGRAITELPPLI